MTTSELLSRSLQWQLLLALLKLMVFYSGPAQAANGKACSVRGPTSYILVFTGHWSPRAFPKQYPMYRPPAHWSKLIAMTHNRQYHLWREGELASPGVRSFAERGVTVDLGREGREARKRRTVGAMYRTAGILTGTGHSTTELLMQPRNPQLSMMVKVVPSPDWFVGVDSVNLCEGDRWRQEVTFDLHPFDAGTDSGFTFSSPNYPTSPPENITQITSQNPSHPANSFYYPRVSELPPLATVRIMRQSRIPARQTPLSNHILPYSVPQYFSETPLDCEVSLWSSWGMCLGSCASGTVRHRTRYILLRPANSGSPCPELEEQAQCSLHMCLSQQ
ncbi:hypothetical protein SKAU_G00430710 [Synaphobranchus kaupii]|uniref:Spondin domain-containing protein n=1 Tax=Synaphobranchus kaupii TaxID=118154 RepID=A0A9Q1I9Y5_SYNKA|nr:hypothetical protein SKAU_G00430710 [Synaphobranchus kaupii]